MNDLSKINKMNVYLNVEISSRELDSKLLLAVLAAARGHQVVISSTEIIEKGLNKGWLPPGIFHTKSLTPGKSKIKRHQNIIEHKNFIGGRYSVLSEVGMLPSELMGLSSNKFKKFDKLICNKNFVDSLLTNVNSIFYLIKRKKTNSIILNYDDSSCTFFKWYQQLVAESLGKKSSGILPIISEMPKDNHSLMQLYLDGNKNSFFTFFDVKNYDSPKIKKKKIFINYKYLKKHDLFSIKSAQKKATINVFKAKGIPFRTFEVLKKNEETLGELFTFFMLETILLGKMLKINPYDQPSVELIKKETKKILI